MSRQQKRGGLALDRPTLLLRMPLVVTSEMVQAALTTSPSPARLTI
jgi:hypothetical protein